jgi:hypothetical protein
MKPLKPIFILILVFVAIFSSQAQSRLELNSDILYTDSIITHSDSIYLKISLFNNSNIDANEISISALTDSNGLALLPDSGINLKALETLDTFLILNAQTFIGSRNTSDFRIFAFTRTPTIEAISKDLSLYYEKLPQERPLITLNQELDEDSFSFGSSYPLRISIKNQGKVDFFRPQGIELFYSVNNSPAQKFFSTTKALIRNGANEIDAIDSIPINDTYFKKGGGNIVVVWPVGFLKVDSISDTVTINWPNALNQKSYQNKVVIYPNPANTIVYLDTKNSSFEEVRIYNLNGKLLLSQKFSNQIEVSDLNRGMYLIMLRGKNESIQTIFIKE